MEILLHYRWLFVKGDVIIGEWGKFGVEIFLRYNRFFVKVDLLIDGVECTCKQQLFYVILLRAQHNVAAFQSVLY